MSPDDQSTASAGTSNRAGRQEHQQDHLNGNSKEQAVLDALEQPFSAYYDETPFIEIMDELRDEYQIDVFLDISAKDDSLTEDDPITFQVNGVRLKNALNVMLREHNATFVVRDEMLQIVSLDVIGEYGRDPFNSNSGDNPFRNSNQGNRDPQQSSYRQALLQAAEQGDAEAQYLLGAAYADGEGFAQDSTEAVKWWRRAAEQGDVSAQINLAIAYSNGEGITSDEVQATKWFAEAAKQGDAFAQYFFGIAYADGEGVNQDSAEAAKWWRRAANQDFADAQTDLGLAYAYGEGVTQDSVEAAKWWRRAAEQGDAYSQYFLGAAYAEGEGITKDLDEAVKWWQMAAKQGNAYAIQRLDSLKTGTSSGRTPVANLDWADVVELVNPGVVLIQTDEGLGTGFFISNNQIITNHHVVVDSEEIKPARRISVKQFNAELEFARGRVYLDQDRDIAVLTLSNITSNNQPLNLSADVSRQAEEVGVIGHPIGLEYSFSNGRISSFRSFRGGDWVQHSAPISPGNSGGPLLNQQGEVIGMNSFFVKGDEESGGAQNLNFAISAGDIRDAVKRANRNPGNRFGSGR